MICSSIGNIKEIYIFYSKLNDSSSYLSCFFKSWVWGCPATRKLNLIYIYCQRISILHERNTSIVKYHDRDSIIWIFTNLIQNIFQWLYLIIPRRAPHRATSVNGKYIFIVILLILNKSNCSLCVWNVNHLSTILCVMFTNSMSTYVPNMLE